jgi:hypothetical protein
MDALAPALRRTALVALALAPLAGGCRGAYYRTMEFFGKEKRDILVERVRSAREGQADAKEQFRAAFERLSELSGFEGGALREAYERASADYDESEAKAERVRDRVRAVEQVGDDLFAEWKREADEYSRPELKARSLAQLEATRASFDRMLAAMQRAERKMAPVLAAFKDTVLVLKHDLNAQAVASLQGTVVEIERDVEALIDDMEASIAEADRFVAGM